MKMKSHLLSQIITISILLLANYLYAGKNIGIGELTIYDTSTSLISKTWINAINVDDSGKVWAGSWKGGLGIFDGISWKTFSTQNSGLPSNCIYKIAFDHNNTAWIGTDSGLVKYDGKTWTVYTPKNSPMKLFGTRAIAIDKNNNVWFGNGNNNEGGLMYYSGDEWKLYTPDNSKLPIGIINDILIDSNNTIWVGTNAGLTRIKGDSWTIYDRSNSILPYSWVNELCIDSEGKIWIGQPAFYSSDLFAGALLIISSDGNTWSFNNPSQTGKASKKANAIACDKRGYMWVSTDADTSDYAVSIFNKKRNYTGNR
jgi:ligand-binding sensor domain-containing protein